ncbi:MAG TPA: hypothetical protein VFI29_10785 [Hanamia sp.]|nr:hypothetical protein [Hanamia sp.]
MIAIAACFYTSEDYKKLLEISDDRESMCDNYEDWLVEFMKMRTGLEEEGMAVSPVRIKLDALLKFCKENNLKNTGEARSKYASYLSSQLSKLDQALRLNTDKDHVRFN